MDPDAVRSAPSHRALGKHQLLTAGPWPALPHRHVARHSIPAVVHEAICRHRRALALHALDVKVHVNASNAAESRIGKTCALRVVRAKLGAGGIEEFWLAHQPKEVIDLHMHRGISRRARLPNIVFRVEENRQDICTGVALIQVLIHAVTVGLAKYGGPGERDLVG